MERKDYTVLVYKQDRRLKKGERLVKTTDHTAADYAMLKHLYETTWFAKDGYRFEIHETWVTSVNAMTGAKFKERFDTPYFASPRSESYFAN